jgi:general stress protein YciG
MKKHGMDLKMPEHERTARDILRGKAKNVTKDRQRLAIAGRKGIIINGTADDPKKIEGIKKDLKLE